MLGRCVDKAARRIPGTSKCLPRAVALQWMLRREHIASQLVIAIHNTDRVGEHAFHAWVEQGGQIVIGHCDRTAYSPVMILAQSRWNGGAAKLDTDKGA